MTIVLKLLKEQVVQKSGLFFHSNLRTDRKLNILNSFNRAIETVSVYAYR